MRKVKIWLTNWLLDKETVEKLVMSQLGNAIRKAAIELQEKQSVN